MKVYIIYVFIYINVIRAKFCSCDAFTRWKDVEITIFKYRGDPQG